MNTIEPVKFDIEGEGIKTDDNYQPRLAGASWSDTNDFIFHQAAIDLCEEISPYTLQEKYSEIVESEIEPIKNVLPIPEHHLHIGDVSPEGRRNRVFYVRGETVIVPSLRTEGELRLVSNNKDAARDLRGKLTSALEDNAEQFRGAGIEEIDIRMGEDYTLHNIQHPNAELEVSTGEPDDFEQQVMDELKPLSESFVSNINVDFVNYSPSPEFDILYALSPSQLLQVEVKDYSGTDEQPGIEDAIHRPLRRASLLGVSSTVTVLRGVDDHTMDELEMESDLRNRLTIVEKPEVKEVIQPFLERSIQGGAPMLRVHP